MKGRPRARVVREALIAVALAAILALFIVFSLYAQGTDSSSSVTLEPTMNPLPTGRP